MVETASFYTFLDSASRLKKLPFKVITTSSPREVTEELKLKQGEVSMWHDAALRAFPAR